MSREVLTRKVWLSGRPEPSDGEESDLTTHPPKWFTSEPPHRAAELYGLERIPLLDFDRSDTKQMSVMVLDTNGFRRTFHITVKRFTDYSTKVQEAATPTTHFIRFGRAVCGRQGVPDEWPLGNRWVSSDDKDYPHKVSCQECLEKMKAP